MVNHNKCFKPHKAGRFQDAGKLDLVGEILQALSYCPLLLILMKVHQFLPTAVCSSHLGGEIPMLAKPSTTRS